MNLNKLNLTNYIKNSPEYFIAQQHNKNVDNTFKRAGRELEKLDLIEKVNQAREIHPDFNDNPLKYISFAELKKIVKADRNIDDKTEMGKIKYEFTDFAVNDNKIIDYKDFIINFTAKSGEHKETITIKVARSDIDKDNLVDKVTDYINYYLTHHSPGFDSEASYDDVEDVEINNFVADENVKINNFTHDYQKGELVKVNENCIKEALKMAGITDKKINQIPDGGVTKEEFEELTNKLNIPVEFFDIKGNRIFKSKSAEKKKKINLTLVGANHVEISNSEISKRENCAQFIWMNKQQLKDKLFDVVFNDKIVPVDCKYSKGITSFRVGEITYRTDPIDRFENCPNDKAMLEYALEILKLDKFKSEYNSKSLKLVSEWAASPTVEKFNHTDELCDSFDINKCYATLLEKCDIDFPVFSIYDDIGLETNSDKFVSAKGSSQFCDYFGIKVSNDKKLGYKYTFKAKELWKEMSIVSDCYYPSEKQLETAILCDKYHGEGAYFYTERNLWVTHRYYSKYPEIKVSKYIKCSPPMIYSKLLINSIIGCFAKTNKITNRYTLSVNYTEAAMISNNNVDVISDFENHQYLFITSDTNVSIKLSNFRPIFNMIVEYGNIMIDKLMKSVFDYKNTVYEIKTDSITVKKGSKPIYLSAILPLTFKQEKSKYMNKSRVVNTNITHDSYKTQSYRIKPKKCIIVDDDAEMEDHTRSPTKYVEEGELLVPDININEASVGRIPTCNRLIDERKSFIIDGDGGCGKSHLIKLLQEKLTKDNIKFKTITTKRCNAQSIDGITIHKFLGFNETGINKYQQCIDLDYVIIDEYTQCSFFKHLLEYKLNNKIRNFILLGNYRQLPGFMDAKYNDLKNIMEGTNKKQHLYDPPKYYNIDIIKDLCPIQIFLKKNYRTQTTLNLIKVDKIDFSNDYDTILAYSNAECDQINANALKYLCVKQKVSVPKPVGQIVLYKDTRYRVTKAITKTSSYILSTLGLNKKTIEITSEEFQKCVFNLCITIYKSQGYEYEKYLIVGYDKLIDKNKYVAESRRIYSDVFILG